MCLSAPSCRVSRAHVTILSPCSVRKTSDGTCDDARREADRADQLNDSDVSAMNTYPLLDNATDATDRCRSCGCAPTRRLFKRRNYCGKCFYLFECLKAVERWDVSKPETLKNIGALRHSYRGGPFL